MKRIACCCLLLLGLKAAAQQKPIYSQYILNNYIINPAISGIENYTDVKLSYRNQWTGIDGAPVSMYMSVHGPLNKKDLRTNVTSFSTPGENPRGKQYMEEYTAPEPHHGVGAVVVSDRTGYISRWSAYATYAYHRGLSSKTSISAGFLLGMSSISLDLTKATFAPGSPLDPALSYQAGAVTRMKPEVGAGLWLYGADYFAGVSVMNIVPGQSKFGSIDSAIYGSKLLPHFFLTAGYKFFLSEEVSMLPSAMVQYLQPTLPQVFANVKLQYLDKAWIGSSFRFGDQLGGFSAMAGLNISSTFNIGYAYDIAPSALNQYSRNTHEVMIGFLLGNRYDDSCPRQNW